MISFLLAFTSLTFASVNGVTHDVFATNRSCIDEAETHYFELPNGICDKRQDSCKHEVVHLSNKRRILCDTETEGGGWAVIQRRPDKSNEFITSNYTDYTYGFGELEESFWFGLENIHQMCPNSKKACKMRIELIINGQEVYASYDYFTVAGGFDNYKVNVKGFTGNQDNIMEPCNGLPFTAKGTLGPKDAINCVEKNGGWWFAGKDCSKTESLNKEASKDKSFYTEMKVKQLGRQADKDNVMTMMTTMTFDVNVTAEDLDKTRPEYKQLKQSLEQQTKKHLSEIVPGLKSVTVVGMRQGSLIVDMKIAVDSDKNKDPSGSMKEAMKVAVKAPFMIKNQMVYIASITADGLTNEDEGDGGNASMIFGMLADILMKLPEWLVQIIPYDIAGMMEGLQSIATAAMTDMDTMLESIYNMTSQTSTAILTSLLQGFTNTDSIFNPLMLTSFGKNLTTLMTSPLEFIESSLPDMIDSFMELIPELKGTLMLVDIALDMMQLPMDAMTGALIQDLMKYPNTGKLISLLGRSPEMLQTMIYTVATDPVEAARLSLSLESLSQLCNASTGQMFSVPPGMVFNMNSFMYEMCSMNLEELLQELNSYQGTSGLMKMFQNETQPSYNSSMITAKLFRVIGLYTQDSNQTDSFPDNPLSRMFNSSMLDEIGSQLPVWINQTMNMSTDKTVLLVSELLKVVSPEMASFILPMGNKAIAITDIMMDMLSAVLKSSTFLSQGELSRTRRSTNGANAFDEMLKDSKSLPLLLDLLGEVPELLGTLMHMISQEPMKMFIQLSQVTTFSSLCAIKPDDLFSLPPNSTWDYNNWMGRLCSLDVDIFMDELQNNTFMYKISWILESPWNETLPSAEYMGIDNITLVMSKAETMFTQVFFLSGHLFNSSAWSSMEEQLGALLMVFDDPLKLMSYLPDIINMLIGTMPEITGYLDIVLDMLQMQVNSMTGYSIVELRKYTTVNSLLDLVAQAPEMLQTLVYTILTQPVKAVRSTLAIELSWSQYCNTSTEQLFIVPQGLDFNMDKFKSGMCSLNPEMLLQELDKYQGTYRLMMLFGNETLPLVKSSVIEEKLNKVIKSFINYVTDQSVSLPYDPLYRLFNSTIWENIGGMTFELSSQVMDIPLDEMVDTVSDLLRLLAPDLATMFLPLYHQSVSIMNLLMEEVIGALNSNTFEEVFKDYNSVKSVADLLNGSPELIETLINTVSQNPLKLFGLLSEVTTFESFCEIKPDDLFTLPMNSTWNFEKWMGRLCSLNVTSLMDEIQNNSIINKINRIFDGAAYKSEPHKADMGLDNITLVFGNLETILTKLNTSFSLSERIFNPSLWNKVFEQLESTLSLPLYFIENPNIIMDSLSMLFNSTSLDDIGGLVSMVSNQLMAFSPEMIEDNVSGLLQVLAPDLVELFGPIYNQAMSLTNLVLGNVIGALDSNTFKEVFEDYSSLQSLADLLNELPEVLETLMYTIGQEPQKPYMKLSQVTSFQSFCAIKPDDLFTLHPNSTLDYNNWMGRLCSLDIASLMDEVQNNTFMYKINLIFNGDASMGHNNVTEIIGKMENLFTKLMTGFSLSERILDPSLWNKVFVQLDDTLSTISSPLFFLQNPRIVIGVTSWLYNSTMFDDVGGFVYALSEQFMDVSFNMIGGIVFDLLRGLFPDVASLMLPMYDQTVSIINLLLDQVLEVLDSKSFQEMFKDSKSLQMFTYLLTDLPQLIETLMYTISQEPQKLSNSLSAMKSIESICTVKPDALFTLPPDSTWDYKKWIGQLCALNVTNLMGDVQTKIFLDKINNIMDNDTSRFMSSEAYMGLDNITQVIQKMEIIFTRLQNGSNLSDRVFNSSSWINVAKQLDNWQSSVFRYLQNPKVVIDSLSIVSGMEDNLGYIDLVLDMLTKLFKLLKGGLKSNLKGFKELTVMVDLLNELPVMIETALYTELKEPGKVAKWTELESFASFCTTPPTDIMTVPTDVNLDLKAYFGKLCKINPDVLIGELVYFTGAQRLTEMMNGTDTNKVTKESLEAKYELLMKLSMSIVTNPDSIDLSELSAVNGTVWTEIVSRVETWLN